MKEEKNEENQIKLFNENNGEQKTNCNNGMNNNSQNNIQAQLIKKNENDTRENTSLLIHNNNEFKNVIDSTNNLYYIPVCRNKDCEGNLKIKIDEEKFLINGICQKNKVHIFNNLYFETFERFYLREI